MKPWLPFIGQHFPGKFSGLITARGDLGSCHKGMPNTLMIGVPTSQVAEW